MDEEYLSLYVLNVICIACEGTVLERSINGNEEYISSIYVLDPCMFVQVTESDLLSTSLSPGSMIRWSYTKISFTHPPRPL